MPKILHAEQRHNACGRSNSEGSGKTRRAALSEKALEAHVHAASAAYDGRSALNALEVVSRPGRTHLAHDAAAAPSSPQSHTALQRTAEILAAHRCAWLDGLLFKLASSVNDALDVIVDGTGMQIGSASYYYIRTMPPRKDSQGKGLRAI